MLSSSAPPSPCKRLSCLSWPLCRTLCVNSLLLGKVGDHNEGFEVGAEFLHGDSTLLSSLVTSYTARLSCSPRSSSSVSLPTAATSSSENCIKPLFAWAQGDGGPDDKTARHDGGE